jgi:TRAP transporter 4TM/12TM fusion protein
MDETVRYRDRGRLRSAIFIVAVIAAVFATVYFVFNLNFFGVLQAPSCYFLCIACIFPFIFIFYPAKSKNVTDKLPWYDILFALLTFAICFYFFLHGWDIAFSGWTKPPFESFVMATILCLLIMEGSRRVGGLAFLIIILLVAPFPLYCNHLPGILNGLSFSLRDLVGKYAFDLTQGFIGLPSQVLMRTLLGFLVFAAIMVSTGGGKFFIDLAIGLLGRFRGGPAKVSVLASGFFGMLSGSTVANVAAIGSFTIPAMKRIGFRSDVAGAVEACASTGGILMPPVMGATAFIMAQLLAIPYSQIIIYAIIPAVLYYVSLIWQTDVYSGANNLKGLPPEQIPSMKQTLKNGWHFILVIFFLLWGLLYMRWEEMTPYYASALLILLAFIRRDTRPNLKTFIVMFKSIGTLFMTSMGVLIPVTFIVAALTYTGVAPAFASSLVSLSGGNTLVALIFGAIACYILGMLGVAIAPYIFLAVTLAPALVKMGLDPVGVNLFIIYFDLLACITPPVAIASFVAAGIAGANPMKTAVQSMKFGVVLYFVPFFFVYSPALVLRGSPIDTVWQFASCIIGLGIIASGLQGYMWFLGKLSWIPRVLLIISGILITHPDWRTTVIGIILAFITIGILIIRKRNRNRESAELQNSA